MAEFQEVMKQWRRMCDICTLDDDNGCCSACPVQQLGYESCDAIYTDFCKEIDWNKFEGVVMTWAAEHPEPKYPTWLEWLQSMNLAKVNTEAHLMSVNVMAADRPIPSDIAQKLGIEPKEKI